MSRTRSTVIALTATLALVLAACSSGGSSDSNGGSSGGGATAAKCAVGALAKVTTPVTITFWHAMNRANEDA
ncbi:MAG: carbohydrate ABC transporter substrate-binding protein, partial [Acidimicrobiia bacterium]|nr:carbohydrate ABC transporter substrate-binding protein [Acidimicrobiia bacterium]